MSDPFDLTISRLVRASRTAVWTAWSTPTLLEKWWCPKPWRAEVTALDLRAAGAFDVVMHGPQGEVFPYRGSFLEVAPAERVVFTSVLCAGWQPIASDLPMTAFVTMADEDGGTRYSARVLHQNAEDRERHVAMGFEGGWGAAIAQLEEVAQAL